MHRFHQTVVVIQRHHYYIFSIPARDNRSVRIIDNCIQYRFQVVSRFRKKTIFITTQLVQFAVQVCQETESSFVKAFTELICLQDLSRSAVPLPINAVPLIGEL